MGNKRFAFQWRDEDVPRILSSNVYQNGLSKCRLTKSDSWNFLNPKILSEEGKLIVSEDPDLGSETLQKLLELNNRRLYRIDLFLANEEDGPSTNDCGLYFISECIKWNYNATWAEFVAHVASIFRLPFLEVALALKRQARRHGLYYFADDTYVRMKWMPKPSRLEPSDFIRVSSLADDWAALSAG